MKKIDIALKKITEAAERYRFNIIKYKKTVKVGKCFYGDCDVFCFHAIISDNDNGEIHKITYAFYKSEYSDEWLYRGNNYGWWDPEEIRA